MYFNCTISIFITFYSVFSLSEIFNRNATLKSKLNSWFSRDVTKIQTKKLSLLLSFLLSCGIRAPLNLNLYKQIFGSKWFFVLRYRMLEFPGFYMTQH